MAKISTNFLNVVLLVLFFVVAACALAAMPDTLFARVPLGRSGLLFYLAGGTLIFWLYVRRGRQRPAADEGKEEVRGEAEEHESTEGGDPPLRVEQVRERIRVRRDRNRNAD